MFFIKYWFVRSLLPQGRTFYIPGIVRLSPCVGMRTRQGSITLQVPHFSDCCKIPFRELCSYYITNFLICFFSGSIWNIATLLLICRWGFGVSILVIAAEIAAARSVNATISNIDTTARIIIVPTPIIPNSQYPTAESIDSPLTTAAAADEYKHIRRRILLLNLNFVI